MSYAVEIQEYKGGPWVANGLRFPTMEEAELYKDDLSGRWLSPVGFRTAERDEPANYRWVMGETVRIVS